MSDVLNNQLSYLIPQKEQEITHNFAELMEMIIEYRERILDSLCLDPDDRNTRIFSKL